MAHDARQAEARGIDPAVSASDNAQRRTHEQLVDWIRGVLGEVAISFEPPGGAVPEGRCIGLYLMELGPGSGMRGNKAPPLQFCVRYLVTAWGAERQGTHEDLCELAFSAMDTADFDVDFEPLPATTWAAYGTAPRPAFRIGLPLRRARSTVVVAPAVRAPLVVAPTALAPLQARLLGPGDVPIAGARVELPLLGRSTQTDHEGRFVFAGVPAGRTLTVRVNARGTSQAFELKASAEASESLPLRMSLS